ncbi:hypothetical protein SH1V18_14340 [Vallitalea longa]|uniref:Uncharacterized protein n=1 Tax=Vallitalea longa TaxID=2936439 RepID=A0A9W6DFQ4_9FIRM|nr:hypothetical protein [Vallitalea longa]GKX28954.1 hypothetical protein SH1V18_14340 [Vallitalea longa]
MNKHKYFFRGVGITLIITTIIFYFIGLNINKNAIENISDEDLISKAQKLGMVVEDEQSKTELTDKEIILKAKKLGMIIPVDNEEENKQSDNNKVIDEQDRKESYNDEKNNENDTVKIQIKYGMSSRDAAKILFDNEVIDDIDECDKYLMVNNIAGKIKIGTYEFKINSTYEEVMKIFTN